ncbi:MAG: AsmA-like C-terminal domain-containing protein [Desulfobacterales bacterium]|nr:AsmA-like C-terminal domain-containing protein [Desulfobacterales bacterium]
MLIDKVMKRFAKIMRWMLAAALVIAVLLIFILIAPRLINIDSVRETLISTLSQKIGGEVKFQKIRLSILPRPHVAVIEGRLTVPETFQADWTSLSMSARLLPLFIGKIDIGAITVDHPKITIIVTRKAAETADGRQQPIAAGIAEKMKTLIGVAAVVGKDPAVIIKAGRLDIRVKDHFGLVFSDMDGRIDAPPDRIHISLKTRTDFCEKIELQADSDLKTFNSRGRIALTHIRPQRLPPNLFAADAPWIGESLINLGLDFKTDGFKTVEAVMQGSLPQLTVLQGGNPVALRAKSFKARLYQDERQVAMFLTEGIFEQPQLTLAVKFVRDHESGQLEMALKAIDVDVPSTRRTVLALAGDTAAVKTIFDIVRGGRVSALRFSSRGHSLGDLGKLENMTLSGSLLGGDIVVPGIGLNIEDVSAEVKILNSMLSAEGIKARYDNTAVLDGSLGLGLWGEKAPFQLDIGLNADLSQVPPILKQVVKDKRVLMEIDRIAVISGRASGRLILGETLADISTKVEVSDFTLAARVAPMPTALVLQGGDLSYGGTAVTVGRLEVKLKGSRLLLGTVGLDWQQQPWIDIQSGSADLQLDEIYTTLSYFASLRDTLKSIKSINGMVTFSRLQLSGPLSDPSLWNFQADGSARNVQVKSDLLPAPLSVRRAGFKATPQRLTISEAETGMMDAALTVSARLTDYRKGIRTADLMFGGTVGAKSNDWLQQRVKMPSHLTIRPPLHFSNGRLTWQRNGQASFSGDLTIHNDLKVSTDIVMETDMINIKKFIVRDKDSTAAFTVRLREGKEIDFGFKGNLQKTTVDKLLADNRTLDGWIKGDLRLTYATGRPMDTLFEGTLSAKDLILTERLGIPLKAESLSVAGSKGKFNITADMLLGQDKQVKLAGQVDHSPRGILFDSALTASGIVLDDLVKALGKDDKQKEASQDKFWEFPVEGVIKLDSAYITYGKYTWRPLRGTVSLKPEKIAITVSEAVLCGISTPGTLTFLPREIQVELKPAAREQEIKTSTTCLLDKDAIVEGRFSLGGEITGRGPGRELPKALAGNLEYRTGKGRIYSGNTFRTIREILAVLNVTEIFRGKLPEVSKEGFGFNSMNARLKIRDNTIVIEEGAIDGLTMNMAAKGVLNLTDQRVNLTVLVAPFKTVDAIVSRIPLLGDILGGSLISVPVSVKGDLQNPEITILSPAAVGEGLLGILKRTLELPVKVIQPLIPEEKK